MKIIIITFVLCLTICTQAAFALSLFLQADFLPILIAVFAVSAASILVIYFTRYKILSTLFIPLGCDREDNVIKQITGQLVYKNFLRAPVIYQTSKSSINAFTIAFGKQNGTLVLHDGIATALTQDELEALLAHEIGHISMGHATVLTLMQSAMLPYVLPIAWVAGLLAGIMQLRLTFWNSKIVSRMLFGLPVVVFPVTILIVVALLRRWEFQADIFAAKMVGRNKVMTLLNCLQGALFQPSPVFQNKLCKIPGKSGFTPMRLESWTHPSVSQRLVALQNNPR